MSGNNHGNRNQQKYLTAQLIDRKYKMTLYYNKKYARLKLFAEINKWMKCLLRHAKIYHFGKIRESDHINNLIYQGLTNFLLRNILKN